MGCPRRGWWYMVSYDTRSSSCGRPVVVSQLMHIAGSAPAPAGPSLIGEGPGHDSIAALIDKGFHRDLRIFCFYDLFFNFYCVFPVYMEQETFHAKLILLNIKLRASRGVFVNKCFLGGTSVPISIP